VVVTVDARKSHNSKSSVGSRARSMSPAHMALVETEVPPPVPEIPASFRDSPVPSSTHQAFHSAAPSIRSNMSWRTSSSASSIGGSSTFTRYSNASARSVSTANTSISSGSGSWRRKDKLPGNIKPMTGIPWVLDELPRTQFSKPKEHIDPSASIGSSKKRRSPAAVNLRLTMGMGLDTINEGGRPLSGKDKSRPSSGRPSSSKDKDRAPKSPIPPRSPTSSIFEQQQLDSGLGKGLTIDTVVADEEGVDLGTGVGKPPKSLARSRLWNWRKY